MRGGMPCSPAPSRPSHEHACSGAWREVVFVPLKCPSSSLLCVTALNSMYTAARLLTDTRLPSHRSLLQCSMSIIQ